MIETARARLKGAGLTDTETELYLALLNGEADARRLSAASGIPYTKVHTVLSRLVEKSLVVKGPGRPSIYAAKQAHEGLADYKRVLIEDLERRVNLAEEAVARLETARDSEKPDIWILKSPESIVDWTYRMVDRAKRGVKFAFPVVPEWVASAATPVLIRLNSEKVILKILLASDLPKAASRLAELGEVRVRDKMFGGGIIVDESEALLFLAMEDGMPSLAIRSNHAGLVHVAKTYFDYLWESSAPAPAPAAVNL